MTTPKLAMPELVVGQAGKELTHNQALAILDQLAQATVVDKDLATPPGSPVNGAMYIVAAGATAEWSGQSGKLAVWLTAVAAWTFITPVNGWSVWVSDEAERYELRSSAWGISSLISADTGLMGYGAGSGGTVTQSTSKATGVTLNKPSGQITTAADSLAANTAVSFTLTNSKILANDSPRVVIKSGATAGAYVVQADAVASGSCRISIRNVTAGALAETLVLQFNNEKGSVA